MLAQDLRDSYEVPEAKLPKRLGDAHNPVVRSFSLHRVGRPNSVGSPHSRPDPPLPRWAHSASKPSEHIDFNLDWARDSVK